MNVSFVDIKRQYISIQTEIDSAIKRVIRSGIFVDGNEVVKFEKEFARFCEVKYAIAVDSGTGALELIQYALGITDGDEVIMAANIHVATPLSTQNVGGKPVLVDCEPDTFNIDPLKIEKSITGKTKAIIVVHFAGQSADMKMLKKIAQKNNLLLIEDACQAHGARYKGNRVGSYGVATAFSFYPGKNLGAFGHGGAIITNNKKLAEKLKKMRIFGQTDKYTHVHRGTNARIDSIQAAILSVKLKHLNTWNRKRQKNATMYAQALKELPIQLPFQSKDSEHVFHLFIIKSGCRDKLAKYLKKKGIQTNIHYPIPVHLQKSFHYLNLKKGEFPVAEKISSEVLSLPMFPELKKTEIKYVAKCIQNFYLESNHIRNRK